MGEAPGEQHPHGPSTSSRCPCCPREPSERQHPPRGHSGTGWMPSSSRAGGDCQGTPGAISPSPPPRLREAFQASRWGRGAAAARRRAEKAIFSRYIFYKSNILCVSALPAKASRAQPWDLTSEPVSQQRLAATWPAGVGRGGQRGSPRAEGQVGGGPPNPLAPEERQDSQSPPPSPPA